MLDQTYVAVAASGPIKMYHKLVPDESGSTFFSTRTVCGRTMDVKMATRLALNTRIPCCTRCEDINGIEEPRSIS